ncbi:MAG: 2-succinyl-5-enolpyruvyl-6-hydroxy-3-cyclohexene-1-carboxylic-acid synthase [Verrucomicrobia bacterium]|nr:2-succinyl-5-enolpyruvyl-6-hydroxy-3-cyclohexene-1-carboxylic-acid synthase [Verrucomicrobiota bacterium]
MNERFAKRIIDTLIEHGVRRFCLSPGSRSTPLAYAIAHDERAEVLVHFDERGMAFHAFGFAKGAKEPVALLVTSGSAVGNLMPAVMEASLEGLPLVVLTADRPPELRECGANQACDQVKIFGNYVRFSFDLPCPDSALPDGFVGSTVAYAVSQARRLKGPVHLNCMFREPFFSSVSLVTKTSTVYEESLTTLPHGAIEKWARILHQAENGVIIVGAHSSPRHVRPILQLAEHLQWPVLPDVLSGVRSEQAHPAVIPYYDAVLKIAPQLKADVILHLGDRFVSKSLAEWTHKCEPSIYALVADHPWRYDPGHSLTHRLECDPVLFAEQILPHVGRRPSWLETWKVYSDAIDNHLDTAIKPQTEPGAIRFLHHHLPAHWALFLANSMPIRDCDQFFFPRFYRGPIHGKRGLSGIDGNIATAIGIAEGSQRPTLAILGDLTALHDINSLSQLKKSRHPVIFLVINNGGGGIFHFLPVAEKKDFFEEYMAGAHGWTFEKAAEMFEVPYVKIEDFAQIGKALREEKSCILELRTDRAENLRVHRHIFEELKTCCASLSSMVS